MFICTKKHVQAQLLEPPGRAVKVMHQFDTKVSLLVYRPTEH